MNINTIQTKTISKFFILFITIFLTSACSESGSENELVTLKPDNISEKVIDASKIALLQGKIPYTANKVTQQNTLADSGIFNSTGKFTYPSSATEFSGNISVAFNVSDAEGIKQVLLGFAGSDLALPVCDEDCGNQFSAYVNAINPKLFGLSGGEHTLILWVEDNDGNLSKIATVNLVWTELIVTGVTASLNDNTEELTVSWNTLTGALRYNVYLSNDVNLTHQNYFELEGGEAQLALTTTSATFTDKAIDTTYYILVSAVDGSGESAFSEAISLINGVQATVLSPNAFNVNEDEVLTGNLLTHNTNADSSLAVQTEPSVYPSNGTVDINSNGDFTYTPDANFNGTDQFSYILVGGTQPIVVSINIIAQNDAPIALNDNYIVQANGSNNIPSVFGVLINDSDIENDSLTVLANSVTQPSSGTLTINDNGAFTYTPNIGFFGTDRFSYKISDGSLTSAEASVILEVTDTLATLDDVTSITFNLDELTNGIYSLLDNFEISTVFGTVTLNGNSLTYTPTLGFDGIDTITFSSVIDDQIYTVNYQLKITPKSVPLSDLTWADENMRLCIINQYGEQYNVNDIYSIYCEGNFETLTDLAQLPNLRYVEFRSSIVVDWSGISELDLFGFNIHNNSNFTDFSLLENQQHLTDMTFYQIYFDDWNFLTKFKNLKYLNVDNSNFTDLSLLSDMTQLERLYLSYTTIDNWSLLFDSPFINLLDLSVSGSNFDDPDLLSNMVNLTNLRLRDLSFYKNQLPLDWSFLSNFPNLMSLDATATNLASLEYLPSSLTSLQIDEVHEISDFSPLQNLQLFYFTAQNTTLTSLEHLSGSDNTLYTLNISGTNISDLTPLLSFSNLMYLHAALTEELPATNINDTLLQLYNNGVIVFEAEDSNLNSIFDFIEDIDGDGLLNDVDDDDDGDGVLDVDDAYPNENDVHELIDLKGAVDYNFEVVTSAGTSGTSRWFEQENEYTTGTSALQSGAVTGCNQSILRTSIYSGNAGATLSFDWKISNNNGGSLALYADGNWLASIQNNTDWQYFEVQLESYTSEIEWRYQNCFDNDGTSFLDNLSVDNNDDYSPP